MDKKFVSKITVSPHRRERRTNFNRRPSSRILLGDSSSFEEERFEERKILYPCTRDRCVQLTVFFTLPYLILPLLEDRQGKKNRSISRRGRKKYSVCPLVGGVLDA